MVTFGNVSSDTEVPLPGTWGGGVAGAALPAGCILMWHGLLANIPAGFVLCDGQNGTPDLRAKFLKGAAAGQDPGGTGGSNTHSHDDHASHTHAYSEVVNHTHPVTDPGHTHTQDSHNHTQNAHNHVITSQTATTGSATSYEHGTLDTSSAEAEATEVTANSTATNQAATAVNQSATTGVTTDNPSGGVAEGATDGPSAALSHSSSSNEPSYYAIAFIMKT